MCSEWPLCVYYLEIITDKDPPGSINISCENILLSFIEKPIYNTHQHKLSVSVTIHLFPRKMQYSLDKTLTLWIGLALHNTDFVNTTWNALASMFLFVWFFG